MAVFFQRLSQRGIDRLRGQPQGPSLKGQRAGDFPTLSEQINKPPARPLTTTPLSTRLGQIPQRGTLGSLPQFRGVNRRFVADLPANVQLQGINSILAGQDSTSTIINNFVRGMAAQGRTPEEIRQAFIAQQKTSANPLVIQ